MHTKRDNKTRSRDRVILLAVFTWLSSLVVSMFAFNDPTVVLSFPFFAVAGILSMVLFLWDSRPDPAIITVFKFASASILATWQGMRG